MKKRKKILGILLTSALILSLCGTAFATEASEQEESDSAMLVDSFFSDSTTTFVEGAKAVGDIVSGIDNHTYAVDTATADTLADDIIADGDIITAITFDASDVDFDTVGEYTVIYRIFIDVEALNDYIEDNDIDDVDISAINSDSIDVCIPCTVSIVDEDIEPADTEETDSDDVLVIEINELTWTYEQVNSIPDVIAGIGSIEAEDEDMDPEFNADVSIVDAVLYDMSSVDTEEPDDEDVAYYTYFDREALIDYMEENDIDIETYDGLIDTTTDYIMVYYGPITELALADVIDGLTDHYVLVDSENIDYEYGITYNDDVVKSIETNSEDVDLSEVGTYNVEYVITIDKNALEEVKNSDTSVLDDTDTNTEIENVDKESEIEDIESEDIDEEDVNTDTEIEDIESADTDSDDTEDVEDEDTDSDDAETPDEDLEDIIIDKTVDVVDEETADELVKDGEVVWTDDNESYGDTEDVAKDETKEESKTDEKTDDKDTEVAVNDTDKDDDSSSSSSSSSSSGSSSSSSSGSSSGSSSSSSSSNSGSSSSSSGNTQTHTHNYVGTITKSATCTSNGTKTYKCSCGASYTESIPATGHNWVATYHEATGHYETVVVQSAYDEKVPNGYHFVCNKCGYSTTDGNDIEDHCELERCGYHAVDDYITVHHDAITEQKWVQDSGAYTSYKCSNCGATK